MTAPFHCPRIVIPGEEELGVQRRCPRCGEFWPEDHEFFYPARRGGFQAYCKACWHERSAAAYIARRAQRDPDDQRRRWRDAARAAYHARRALVGAA